MNFKQLETFATIVQLGSFAAAAAKLNATQSTISARVQELEQDLGVALFDRVQRRAHLTAKGRELLPYAQSAVSFFAEIRQRVGSPSALSGVVRVGVAELVAVTWLPVFAAALHARYPDLTLELDVSLTAELSSRLREGDLDLILIPGTRFDSSLEINSLGSVEFAWTASPSLDLPKRPLTSDDLRRWRILSLGEQSFHFDTVEHWLGRNAHRQQVDICNSMSVVAALTVAGLGVSLLPPICYRSDIEAGRLRLLKTDPPVADVEFFAVYFKRRPNSILRLIVDLAQETSSFSKTRNGTVEKGAGSGAVASPDPAHG